MKNDKKQVLIVGNAVPKDMATALGAHAAFHHIIPTKIKAYASGETYGEFFPNDAANQPQNATILKDADVVIVQSQGDDVTGNTMALLTMAHMAKHYGAKSVTAAIPFAAFARQDREFDGKFMSVSADLLPRLLRGAGVDHVMTVTPHSKAAVQFFVDEFGANFTNISAGKLFADDIKARFGADAKTLSIGAPDGANKPNDEGQRRARGIVTYLFNEVSTHYDRMFRIAKARTSVSDSVITSFDGNVAGKTCVIADDMIDGGSTMINAATLLKKNGAGIVAAYATHAICSGDALEKILSHGAIDRLVVTDTIPSIVEKLEALAKTKPELAAKVSILSVADMIGNAVMTPQVITAAPARKQTP